MANGQPGEAARNKAQLASLLLATERPGSALIDLEAALDGVADLASDASSVELSGQLARAYVLVGDDRLAFDWADRTLDACRHLDLPAVAVDTLITRGTASLRLGNDEAGLADLHAAITDAQRLGLIGAELRARNNLAWLVASDDPQAAMETARGGLELATRMGVGDMALQLADVVCTVAIDSGDWDTAMTVLGDVRDRLQAPAHRVEFAASAAILGALRGDPRAGAELDALEPLDLSTEPQVLGLIDKARAWIALVDGRLDDARRLAESAAARSLGADRHAALVLATRAGLWLGDEGYVRASIERLGQVGAHGHAVRAGEMTLRAGVAGLAGEDAAAGLYEEAVAAWRTLRLPLHLALCLAERQRLLPGTAGPARDVGGHEAEVILTTLGATGMLAAIRRQARPSRPCHADRRSSR